MKIRIWLILGVFVCGVSWLFGSVIAFSANFSQNGWQMDELNKGNSVEVAIQWVVVSTSCWNVFIELFAIELEQLLGRIFFLLENEEFYQCEGNRLELLWKRVFRFMWIVSRKFGDCITLVLNQIMRTHKRNIEGCTCKLSLREVYNNSTFTHFIGTRLWCMIICGFVWKVARANKLGEKGNSQHNDLLTKLVKHECDRSWDHYFH